MLDLRELAAKQAIVGKYSVYCDDDRIYQISLNDGGDIYINLPAFGRSFRHCSIKASKDEFCLTILTDDSFMDIGDFVFVDFIHDSIRDGDSKLRIDVTNVTKPAALCSWYFLDRRSCWYNIADVVDSEDRAWPYVFYVRVSTRRPLMYFPEECKKYISTFLDGVRSYILDIIPEDFSIDVPVTDFATVDLLYLVRQGYDVDSIKSYLFGVDSFGVQRGITAATTPVFDIGWHMREALDITRLDYIRAYLIFTLFDDPEIDDKLMRHLKRASSFIEIRKPIDINDTRLDWFRKKRREVIYGCKRIGD